MKRKITTTFFMLLMMFLASSCQTDTISPIQRQLPKYSIGIKDLPSGWGFQGKDWGANYGGESYSIIYQADPSVFITQTLSIYAGGDEAKQAYKEWQNYISKFPNVQPDRSLSFSPSDRNDDHEYSCGQLQPNDPLKYCVHLQRHDNIINYVKINLDDRSNKNLTSSEINDILTVLDTRLTKATIAATSSSDSP